MIELLTFIDFFFSCIINNNKSVVLKEGLAMVCVGLDESECNAEDSSATLPGLRIKNGIQVSLFELVSATITPFLTG
jgi:hypothetical protein